MIGNADGDIAHELHALFIGKLAHRAPLAETQPLHPGMKQDFLPHGIPAFAALCVKILAGQGGRAEGGGPEVPALAATRGIHQPAEERVIVQPRGFLALERAQFFFFGGKIAREESCECRAQKIVFASAHLGVIHQARMRDGAPQ